MTKKKLFIIIFSVVVLDWGVKWFVFQNMHLGITHPIWHIGNWGLSFTRAHNYGAAFSFLADQGGWQRIFFLLVGVVAIYLMSSLIRDLPPERMFSKIGLACVIGGAIGNMGDRLLLGYVVDFVDVMLAGWNFYIFNVADIAISIGAAIWILDQLIGWRIQRTKTKSVNE